MDSLAEKIHKAALRFLVPLTDEETYKIIVEEAVKLVNGHAGSILLMENNELVRAYSSVPSLYQVDVSKKNPLGARDPRYTVVKERTPMVLSARTMTSYRKKFPALKDYGDRAAIMIPLSYRDKSIGMLSIVALQNSEFTVKEMNVLTLFGSLASLAIRKTQLYTETKQALETRDLFISMAAHELRTPLTALSGYAELLNKKFQSDETSTEARWVKELYQECSRLRDMINELLAINRIKAGGLDYIFQKVRLSRILTRAVNSFDLSRPGRIITLAIKIADGQDVVVGDSNKLLQVCTNVIENAVKYSGSESEVIVTLRSKGRDLVVEVKDEGIGIPQNDLQRIFEGYHRGENTRGEGLGIGLFLAKSIIDKHNGSIKVKSRVGKGTTFLIVLPKDAPDT